MKRFFRSSSNHSCICALKLFLLHFIRLIKTCTRNNNVMNTNRWGGNARYILRKEFRQHEDLYEDWVHTRATPDLTKTDSTIASQWALDTLVRKSGTQQVYSVYAFMRRCAPSVHFDYDEYHSGSGELWEAAAHLRLMQGGVFHIRDTLTGVCSNVTLSSSTAARFAEISHISRMADDAYCRPYSHTSSEHCALIDAVRQPGHLYILNSDKQKSTYTAEHLWAAVSNLYCDPHEVVTLYWIVPPDRFDEFEVPQSIPGIEMLHVDAQTALRSIKHVVLEVDVEHCQLWD
jgi:hypothetical protein